MLLRFAVSNHLSIKDSQELSFVKSALKGSEEGLLSTPALPKDKVLPAAIIYGPNASGKSNFLDALMFMRGAVLNSHRQWEPDGKIPRQPFLLSHACMVNPSRFEMDFDIEGVRYNYGFACTSSEFVEEWLYSAPVGHQRMIFERNGPNPDDVKFGTSFTGQKQAIAQLMRPNSLFLSAAFQNNHQMAKSVVAAFQKVRGRNSLSMPPSALDKLLKDSELDGRIMSFLTEIGTGITKHRQVENARSDEQIRTMRSLMEIVWNERDVKPTDDERKSLLEGFGKDIKIEFAHKSEDGDDVFFEASRESAGTRRLIPLLQDVMLALDQGNVCVIDEIDASLHTQVCDAIIALFTNGATNPNGAQIIATTHDTNLLNASNLRRDELWLVEKSPSGASELYSLADVKTRDKDNFERSYLHGRYGAVPFAGSAADLIQSL
jgi:AAA domain, putative AbiEii toxin, Type IV TA system